VTVAGSVNDAWNGSEQLEMPTVAVGARLHAGVPPGNVPAVVVKSTSPVGWKRGAPTSVTVAVQVCMSANAVPHSSFVGLARRVALFAANVAITACAWFIVTWQLPVPEHAPDQPANVEPDAGVAVRVTGVPSG
jgi:hypothetical protein